MAISRINTKGPLTGQCNICGSIGKLTEDHTPPKGSIKVTQVQLHHIINHLNIQEPAGKGRLLQNGVKYRTLCASCNNSHLGLKYDPAFNNFVNSVGNHLKSNAILPAIIPIEIEPQKIMRSLIGHLAAQGVDRYKKGPDTEPIKKYFLDDNQPLPEKIRVYYWLYPYKSHVMARDCALLDLTVGKSYCVWFIKFFPIAFMVTFDQPNEIVLNIKELSLWRNEVIDFKVSELIRLENIPHKFWPEAPTDTCVVTYGKEAIVSYQYKPQR